MPGKFSLLIGEHVPNQGDQLFAKRRTRQKRTGINGSQLKNRGMNPGKCSQRLCLGMRGGLLARGRYFFNPFGGFHFNPNLIQTA